MRKFRLLRADEIDCRPATIKSNGCSLLLYKDARVDMRILDETVGAENWQRSHTTINGNLFCRIGIKCDGEWVWKEDVGSPTWNARRVKHPIPSRERGLIGASVANCIPRRSSGSMAA